jgi:hypothetical protein
VCLRVSGAKAVECVRFAIKNGGEGHTFVGVSLVSTARVGSTEVYLLVGMVVYHRRVSGVLRP